jgi:lauroyl/myristoyl acyltransferase
MVPAGWLFRFGRLLDPLFQLLGRGHKRLIGKRVAAVMDRLPPGCHPETVSRAVVSNAVERGLADLVMDRLVADGKTAGWRIQGLEHLQTGLQRGEGAIIVGAHCFANRLAKRYLARQGYDILSVRNLNQRDARAGMLGRWILQRKYIDFLHGVIGTEAHPQQPDCGLRILAWLRSGGLVSIYLDGATSREVKQMPFLGETRPFATGFLHIVHLTRAPVLPMVCRGGHGGLEIEFQPHVQLVPADSAEEFAEKNLPQLVALLESIVLGNPDQWELWTRM